MEYIGNISINDILSIWTFILLVVLMIPGLIETVRAGNRMTKSIRGAHEIGIKASDKLKAFHL